MQGYLCGLWIFHETLARTHGIACQNEHAIARRRIFCPKGRMNYRDATFPLIAIGAFVGWLVGITIGVLSCQFPEIIPQPNILVAVCGITVNLSAPDNDGLQFMKFLSSIIIFAQVAYPKLIRILPFGWFPFLRYFPCSFKIQKIKRNLCKFIDSSTI